MNGIIYCRVSSKEQMEGTSLQSQQLACEEYAHLKRITLLKIFIEEGESAKFADRTQLLSLIEFVRERPRQIQVLLVWKVDRFARNVTDHFNVKATLRKYGVEIVSVTEPIDANPEGNLMETILAGFAQFDNDIRAARTVQGMRRKIQEGLFPWKAPLGYKSDTASGTKKTQPDRPDQPTFGLLQKTWMEFATGAYTKAEMLRRTETWGVVTRQGVPLSNQSLNNLLANPYYAGILVDPWSREEFPGLHIPMVTRDDFNRVQDIIKRRSRSLPHHKSRVDFPLRGLVRCAGCKHPLTASFSRGRSRRYGYYHCWNHSCGRVGKTLRVEKVHEEFLAALAGIAPTPGLADNIGDFVKQSAEERRRLSATRRSHVRETIEKIEQQRGELIRMRAQSLISDDDFLKQRELLAERRRVTESSGGSRNIDVTEIRKQLDNIIAPLDDLVNTWHALSGPRRSRFQLLIFPLGFVAGAVGTAERGLIFKLIGQLERGDTHGVPLTDHTWNQILAEIQDLWKVLKLDEGEEPPRRKCVRRRYRK